jgi:hypothetical protein
MIKVLDTGHIDGGAYRWVKLADGSSRVEGWGPKGWTPGGASIGEIADAPPVGERFAGELGIPPSDLGSTYTESSRRPPTRSMSPTAKSENLTVLETGHIDGGAYRVVRLGDGSERVEGWGAKGWTPGGSTFWEIANAPPVSARFAAELGIPVSDLEPKNEGDR